MKLGAAFVIASPDKSGRQGNLDSLAFEIAMAFAEPRNDMKIWFIPLNS